MYADDSQVIVSVACPRCGELELPPAQVRLVTTPGGPEYQFRCNSCHHSVSHQADDAVVAVLAELDAAYVDTALTVDDAPLTVDDLLDLMLAPLTDFRAAEAA